MPQTAKYIDDESEVNVKLILDVSDGGDAHPLAVIRGISAGIKSLEGPLREAVANARRQRATWEEIGEALGVTRQSAWERFSLD